MANYRTKIILDNSSHIIFNHLIKPNCLTNNHIYLGYTNTNKTVLHYSNNYFYEKLADSTSNYYIYNAILINNSCISSGKTCHNVELSCCSGLICDLHGDEDVWICRTEYVPTPPPPSPCGKINLPCCSGNICDNSSLMCRHSLAIGDKLCLSVSGTIYLTMDNQYRYCAKFWEKYCGTVIASPNYICTNYCKDPYFCTKKIKSQCDLQETHDFEIPGDISVNYDCTKTRKYCPATPCGNINQKCCSGNKCNNSLKCNPYNICLSNVGHFITDNDLSTCKQYAEELCHLYPESNNKSIVNINKVLCNNKYCSISSISNDSHVPYYTSIDYDCTYTMNYCPPTPAPTPAPTPKHGYITFSSSGDMNTCYAISEKMCELGFCRSLTQCPYICNASSICNNLHDGEIVYYDCGGNSDWCSNPI